MFYIGVATNIITSNPRFEPNTENSLLYKYGMNILNTPFVSEENIELGLRGRSVILAAYNEALSRFSKAKGKIWF